MTDSQTRRERKRISDRLSQRTVRERTKRRIAELEKQVQTLLSGSPDHALQEKIRENEALREEVVRLRQVVQRIGNICSMNATIAGDASQKVEGIGGTRDNSTQNIFTIEQGEFQTCPEQSHLAEGCQHDTLSGRTTFGLEDSDVESAAVPCGHTALSGVINELPVISPNTHFVNGAVDSSLWTCGLLGTSQGLDKDGNLRSASEEVGAVVNLPLFDKFTPLRAQGDAAWDLGIAGLPDSLEAHGDDSSPYTTGPNWPCLLRLPYAKTAAIGIFDVWLQHVLVSYSGCPRDRLNALLPVSPCLGALFSPNHCRYTISRELGDILRRRYPNADIVNLAGAFWSLHMLLRYYLAPEKDQWDHTPSNMRPIEKQQVFALNWVHFLPWPHLRQAVMSEPKGLLGTEFEHVISEGIYLDWRLGPGEAINFNSTDATKANTSSYCSDKCTSVTLTDTFKSHIAQAHNWCLKPNASDLRAKFPVLDIITR
ncbi:hypothetical protein BDV06DRAFT_225221 [Aspergillus oleicola]